MEPPELCNSGCSALLTKHVGWNSNCLVVKSRAYNTVETSLPHIFMVLCKRMQSLDSEDTPYGIEILG